MGHFGHHGEYCGLKKCCNFRHGDSKKRDSMTVCPVGFGAMRVERIATGVFARGRESAQSPRCQYYFTPKNPTIIDSESGAFALTILAKNQAKTGLLVSHPRQWDANRRSTRSPHFCRRSNLACAHRTNVQPTDFLQPVECSGCAQCNEQTPCIS
jgi:hypothetical protein